eukprot:gb/GEZN01004030.1/.p2 GENE.gb/GEZN01004030.1/~~gb/GEZN01004030.1/.p2  ORF type:complete len:257 (-),score=32.79 gb/GEZN01004030.1/:128-898(-)
MPEKEIKHHPSSKCFSSPTKPCSCPLHAKERASRSNSGDRSSHSAVTPVTLRNGIREDASKFVVDAGPARHSRVLLNPAAEVVQERGSAAEAVQERGRAVEAVHDRGRGPEVPLVSRRSVRRKGNAPGGGLSDEAAHMKTDGIPLMVVAADTVPLAAPIDRSLGDVSPAELADARNVEDEVADSASELGANFLAFCISLWSLLVFVFLYLKKMVMLCFGCSEPNPPRRAKQSSRRPRPILRDADASEHQSRHQLAK